MLQRGNIEPSTTAAYLEEAAGQLDHEPNHVLVASDDPSELVPLEEVERRYILRVIDACQGNKSQSARILGIGRKTLYRRLVALGVIVGEDD